MIKIFNFIFLITAIPVLSGCGNDSGHGHTKGSIVTSQSGQIAQVCEEGQEVKIGDRLEIYESNCTNTGKNIFKKTKIKNSCVKIPKGQAEIVEISDSHFSKIKAIDSVILKAGQTTKKLNM